MYEHSVERQDSSFSLFKCYFMLGHSWLTVLLVLDVPRKAKWVSYTYTHVSFFRFFFGTRMLLLSHHPAWWGGDSTADFWNQEYRLPSWPTSQPEGFTPRAVGLWNFSPWYSWPITEAVGWVSVVERLRLPSFIQFLIMTRRLYEWHTDHPGASLVLPLIFEAVDSCQERQSEKTSGCCLFLHWFVQLLEKLSCREDCRFSTPGSSALEEADPKR